MGDLKKMRVSESSILHAACQDLGYDVFDRPLTDKEKKSYDETRKQFLELKATGKPFILDIPSEI